LALGRTPLLLATRVAAAADTGCDLEVLNLLRKRHDLL